MVQQHRLFLGLDRNAESQALPNPDLPGENLHLTRTFKGFGCTLKFEEQCSEGTIRFRYKFFGKLLQRHVVDFLLYHIGST